MFLTCLERLAIVRKHGTVTCQQIKLFPDALGGGHDNWIVVCAVGKGRISYQFVVTYEGEVLCQRKHVAGIPPLNTPGWRKPQARFLGDLDKFLAGYGDRIARVANIVRRVA